MRPHWSAYLAIGLLAGAIMVFELALLRIFSFAIWHHFASMVISIALLGFGVGGIALQLFPQLGSPSEERAARYAGAFALLAVVTTLGIARIPFDPTRIADEPVQALYLLAFYGLLAIPFAIGGLAIVTLLGGHPERSDRLYGSDLAGAAIGCVVTGPLLSLAGVGGAVILAGAGAAFSAWLLHQAPALRGGVTTWVRLAFALALLAAAPFGSQIFDVPPGKGKALALFNSSAFPAAKIVHTEWNELARVDVVEKAPAVTWTLNSVARVPSPQQTQIVLDGDAATPILNFDGDPADLDFLDYTLSSAAYQIFDPENALVIGAGGGVDVWTALHHGVGRVKAVELNPVVVRLVTGPYADVTGNLFARPEVELHVAEGRSFVRRQEERFDVIQLSLIDTWAASASGAYSLSEGYLYTVEAFEDYLDHLSDDGVLAMTRWLWEPPRETLKLVTVAAAALRERGAEYPPAHIALLGHDRMGSILVKRNPFTKAELASIEQVAKERHFDTLYLPFQPGGGMFGEFLTAIDPEAFYLDYEFDVTPATDDSPFFFNFGRWPDAAAFVSGWRESMFGLSGRLVLVAALIQAGLLSLALLVLPLLWQRSQGGAGSTGGRGTGSVVLYFSLIGLCFMLLEIVLMQRFTLFLGHPLYAVAFVLAVMLGAAGLGSMASRSFGSASFAVFGGIVGISVLYAFGLPSIFQWALGWSLAARLALGVLLLFPLGFLLGVPFPAGLARLVRTGDARESPTIGWAWAANGCASVVGPLLASLFAMDFGFAWVMVAAAVGYAGAYAVYARAAPAAAG